MTTLVTNISIENKTNPLILSHSKMSLMKLFIFGIIFCSLSKDVFGNFFGTKMTLVILYRFQISAVMKICDI